MRFVGNVGDTPKSIESLVKSTYLGFLCTLKGLGFLHEYEHSKMLRKDFTTTFCHKRFVFVPLRMQNQVLTFF